MNLAKTPQSGRIRFINITNKSIFMKKSLILAASVALFLFFLAPNHLVHASFGASLGLSTPCTTPSNQPGTLDMFATCIPNASPTASIIAAQEASPVYSPSTAAPTGSIIGYMVINPNEFSGCSNIYSTYANGKRFPIYQSYGTVQNASPFFNGCINSVVLTSNDKVQLTCYQYGGPNYPGPILTGPGTFTPTSSMSPQSCVDLSKNPTTGSAIFFSSRVTVSKGDASIIGYASVSAHAQNGGSCLPAQNPTATGQKTNITNAYGVIQTMGGCIQSITLTTTDSVQLSCITPFGGFTIPANWQSYNGPTITGPGTFIENCSSDAGYFSTVALTVSKTAPPPPTNSAPSNLKVATTTDLTKVNLFWQDNSSNQTGFDIERSTSGGSFVPITIAGANATSYADTGLTSGTAYQYRIAAISPSGNSGYSNVASVTTVNNVTIITVGGFTGGLPIFGGLKTWINGIKPGSIYIPLRTHSIASVTNTLISTINSQISAGNRVLVVAHSLGSFIAFNIRNDFPNAPVKFIYVDPPYNYSGLFAIVARVINRGSFSTVSTARSGISTDSNSVKWTNGTGAPLNVHNPFDCLSCLNNPTNLANLKNKIVSTMQSSSWGTATTPAPLGSIASAPTLPTINGLLNSSGQPIASFGPGDTVTITGSGFDLGANDIDIQNVNDPTVYYDFYDYASPDGNTLTFTLPNYYSLSDSGGASNTVSGTYTLQVAGLSSDWSNVGTVTITSGSSATPPAPTNVIPDTTTSGQFIMAGLNFSPTGNAIGLTPATSASLPLPGSNTASVWEAFMHFIKSLFGFKNVSAQVINLPSYIISGLTSNGSSVAFQVPSNVPNGTYKVSVRSLNTAWVNTTYTITVGGSSVTPPNSTTTPTPASMPATLTYSCPTGATLNSISHTCKGTTITAATTRYSCPIGSILNSSSATCSKLPTSIPATRTYSCPTGYTLSGSRCRSISKGLYIVATSTYSCQSGYTLNSTTKRCSQSVVTTTVPATVKYSCPTGSTLNSVNNTCIKTISTRATTTYTCPSGYTLNSVNKTCTKQVSSIPPEDLIASAATSTSTASIWDVIVGWFGNLFH
jgi:pimeloyl-ACP methyl ester carboxylesterase